MKKFLTILLVFVLLACSSTFFGCSIYDGKYKDVDVNSAKAFSQNKFLHSIDKGGLEIKIDVNLFGQKSKTSYEIVKSNGDLKMHGHSNPVGISTEFYYTGGYVYAQSEFDGDVHRVKQKIDLSQVVFGTPTLPNIDDRVTEEFMFDLGAVVDYFSTNDDSKYFISSDDEYDKIKISLSTEEYYPTVDHSINSTITIYFVFGKGGNYLGSKIVIKDIRVSRKYKETSTINVTIGRYDGEIDLPSPEELATYIEFEE